MSLKEKFADFCKEHGTLKFERNIARCYIKPDTILDNLAEFREDLEELLKLQIEDLLVTVAPEDDDIRINFYKFAPGKDRWGAASIEIHERAENIVISTDYKDIWIRGQKGDNSGCVVEVDGDGELRASCLYITPEEAHDTRISSVTALVKL